MNDDEMMELARRVASRRSTYAGLADLAEWALAQHAALLVEREARQEAEQQTDAAGEQIVRMSDALGAAEARVQELEAALRATAEQMYAWILEWDQNPCDDATGYLTGIAEREVRALGGFVDDQGEKK